MDKLKYIKLELPDGSYTESIPLSVQAGYVDINSTMTLEDYIEDNDDTIDDLQTQVNNNTTSIAGLANGSPLVADSVSGMTNTSRVYVNTSDGYWYYYNGSAWTQGGVYQATELAEESVGYQHLDEKLTKDLVLNFETTDILGKPGYYYNSYGEEIHGSNNAGYATFSATVESNEMYKIRVPLNTTYVPAGCPAYMLKQNDTVIERKNISDVTRVDDYFEGIIKIPQGVNTFQFQATYPLKVWAIKVDSYKETNIKKEQLSSDLQDIFSDNWEEITPASLIPNCYLKGDFSFDAYNSADTYQVDVNPGDKFKITVKQLYAQPIMAFCTNQFKATVTVSGVDYENIYKQHTTVKSSTSSYAWVNYEFTIPEYCNKLYINKSKSDNTFSLKKSTSYSVSTDSIDFEQLKSDLNPLDDKIIAFLGDSITAASTAGYKGWPVLIQENNPTATIRNIAHDGATIADNGQSYSVYNQIQNLYNNYDDVDYIIIQGGVNDLWQSIPLGEYIENDNFNGETAYDTSTFSGGLEWIFHYCYTHFPGKKIGYIVTQKVIYTNGFYNFMNRAKAICDKWSIPYVDLYNKGNLNFYITSQRQNYSRDVSVSGGDGCHPNLAGYKILTPKIENWLKYEI